MCVCVTPCRFSGALWSSADRTEGYYSDSLAEARQLLLSGSSLWRRCGRLSL
jgi:hypothetical protein